ncbi:hypothetical protein LguiA_004743 [Lonicera macranthoides]
MWANRDANGRKIGVGNVFVKVYVFSGANKIMLLLIESHICNFCVFYANEILLYSFVQFVYDELANSAIEKLNGSIVSGKQMYVFNLQLEEAFKSFDVECGVLNNT